MLLQSQVLLVQTLLKLMQPIFEAFSPSNLCFHDHVRLEYLQNQHYDQIHLKLFLISRQVHFRDH